MKEMFWLTISEERYLSHKKLKVLHGSGKFVESY